MQGCDGFGIRIGPWEDYPSSGTVAAHNQLLCVLTTADTVATLQNAVLHQPEAFEGRYLGATDADEGPERGDPEQDLRHNRWWR